MKSFDQTHLAVLMITVAFFAVTMFAAHKLSRKGQNILFALGAVLCAGGIFWRYAMGMTFDGGGHPRYSNAAGLQLQFRPGAADAHPQM